MTVFDHVPDTRPMRENHRLALRREMVATVTAAPRRWHRPSATMMLVFATATVGVSGAAAAAIYIASKENAKFTPISVPPGPTIPQQLGVLSTTLQPPFSSQDYLTGHLGWANKTSTQFIEVFAGSPASDPNQGVVVVFKSPLDNPTMSGGFSLKDYPTLTPDGALTMTGSNGWVITLRAASGATYYFDVTSNSYVPKG